MAKLAFTKLSLKPNNEITIVKFNGQDIEVKQYLSIDKKIEIISKVLELSHDQNNFSNPIKVRVYTALEIIEKYTNISITEKQKENPTKLYDLLFGSGLLNLIFNVIPICEKEELLTGIEETIEAFYKYHNSILGIIDILKEDYSNLDLDASAIQQKLSDPQNLELLKGIMTQLG